MSLPKAIFLRKVKVPTEEWGEEYDAGQTNLEFNDYPA